MNVVETGRARKRGLHLPRTLVNGMLASGVLAAGSLGMALGIAAPGWAQTAPAAAASARQSGTVKSITDHDFVLTDGGGQDHTVTIPAGAKVLIVPPGSKDLTSAAPGSLSDLQAGDRVLVNAKAGESGPDITAARVVVMKSTAIAQSHASDEAAWTAGVGGLVKSVDPATNTIVIASGARTITISTTPATTFRRYAGGSVRFEDATRSSLAAVAPGDQLRARGSRSADGSAFTAEGIVEGSFKNYSGEIASVDAANSTVTLKDLVTKKPVTVAISAQSNLKRLPPEVAARFAARQRGGAAAGAAAGQPGRASGAGDASGTPASAPGATAGTASAGGSARAGTTGQGGPAGLGGGSRGGGDLSSMISRLPSETLGGLKVGEAVMIVASSAEGAAGRATAITLLAGVEPILSASSTGEAMTLSPWSVGGGGGEGEAGATP